jgi:CheY-like chemotaxis protein
MLASIVDCVICCDPARVSIRVLIVDDNTSFLDVARAVLEREGITVAGVASSAAEALREADRLLLDLILVDITLADESGFELARRLVERDHAGERAVILISTRAEADFADLIEASPAAFLAKCELSADALRDLLEGHPRPRPPQR